MIARELCANLLIHREYSNPYPAKLIIGKECILTENANKPRIIGFIDLNNYSPYPKNPKIASFFKEIGLADELGSGIKKIAKYTKIYSGGIPEFKEDEIFKVKIPLINEEKEDMTSQELRIMVYKFIKDNLGVTRKEINEYIYPKLNEAKVRMDSRVRTALTYLRTKELIVNSGTDTKPIWVKK